MNAGILGITRAGYLPGPDGADLEATFEIDVTLSRYPAEPCAWGASRGMETDVDAASARLVEWFDAQGNRHDWRVEFVDKVASLQKGDGSWAGDKKWMEDNPVLVTAYVAIALQETIEDLKQHPPK